MVASIRTLEAVAKVIEKYVPEELIGTFMLEMLAIDGNESFKESVKTLDEILGA